MPGCTTRTRTLKKKSACTARARHARGVRPAWTEINWDHADFYGGSSTMAAVPAVLAPGECLGSTHFAPFSDLCWSRTLRRSKTAACSCDMGSALTLLQQAMVSTSAEARRLAVAKNAHAGHLRKDKQVRQQQCGTVARSPALATS